MNKIDLICPIFHVNLETFKIFIETWIQNIPIKTLIIGIGKENQDLKNLLYYHFGKHKIDLLIIEQYDYKTLGYCLQELMEAVTTDYFVYLHADVEILLNWFSRMWEARVRGILESLKDPSFGKVALVQARKYRAYSGAQLILKEAIKDLKWEDDYIYCQEDLILKSVVLNRGFTYVKTPIYHKHYRMFSKRTQPRDIIWKWQFKGVLKYCKPTHQLMNYIKGILRSLKAHYKIEYNLEDEIKLLNPKWLPYL